MEILLVIDMQQKYMDNYEPDLLDRVNVRIHEAVDAGMPVVYVRNVGKLENEEKYVLAEGLDVVSEYVFAKRWPSAFSSEEFVQFIERMQVDAIAATNDNFYIKELPEMQEAGIVIVSD